MTIITRFGKDKIQQYLPKLLRGIKEEGLNVVWVCDPMHGNTFMTDSKIKTRHFDDISSEIGSFFQIHQAEGTNPGGVHFELTGKDVTECVGGSQKIEDVHLDTNYATTCDPRLNAQQSLELAFSIAEMLKK